MKTKLVVPALVAAFVATSASADDWYISGFGGLTAPNSTIYNDGTNGAGNPEFDIDRSAMFGLAVGREILPNFRLELEYSKARLHSNDDLLSGFDSRALDTFSADAQVNTDTLMLNAIYDFETNTAFTPYVRGGIGQSFYDVDGSLFVSSAGGNTFGGFLPATFNYDGSGSNFAYQVGLGAAYALSDKIDLTVEYRYSDFGTVATDYDENGDRLQSDLTSQGLFLGIRYAFN